MKDLKTKGEGSQKRTSSTSKHEISSLFSIFAGSLFRVGIRIPSADPDLDLAD